MDKLFKIIICLVLFLTGLMIYEHFFQNRVPSEIVPGGSEETLVPERPSKPEVKVPEETQKQETVYVYFLKTDKNKVQYLTPVQRKLPEGVSRVKFCVTQLLNGPSNYEDDKGVYTAVPDGVRLISVNESANSVTVDLSADFGSGGGSDSIYSRMRQLIKTVLANTDKDFYLKINGKRTDVIGGEGITFTQPLTENSLDE